MNKEFHVMTPQGTAALAESLAKHDPVFLADITMIENKFSPLAGVGYLSDSQETQALVVKDVAAARVAYIKELKEKK